MRTVELHEATPGDPPAQFFVTVGYGSSSAPDDEVILATIDGHIAGVVRLSREDSLVVLRGVQVSEHWRGRGIGGRLLDAVARHLANETSFVIAYAHLEAFYARAGWVRIEEDVPEPLSTRAVRFRSFGDDVYVGRRAVQA